MAYQVLKLGYFPTDGFSYTGTTDSPSDFVDVPIDTYFYDISLKTILYKNESGFVSYPFLSDRQITPSYNTASTQWVGKITTPLVLPNGGIANGMTTFDNIADKLAEGTTPYYEWNLSYGLSLVLSGTSGTANVNILGVNYLLTFNTDLLTTAVDFVNLYYDTIFNATQITSNAVSSTIAPAPRIRFGSEKNTFLNTITITTLTGDLSGTFTNDFVGGTTAVYDHVRVPYIGTGVDKTRIHHTFRVNFNINTGNTQTYELGLYRFTDDTLIGSSIPIVRSVDFTGQQQVFETYTSSETDAFVLGGFYFALKNDSGSSVTLSGSIGLLFQSVFEYPLSFS